MGMIPDPGLGIMPEPEEVVRLIGSRDVLKLTGLSADQLREWTVRRGFVQPDIPAARQGQQAQFGWQTVLLLRLAVVMRGRFHIELQVHRDLLLRARQLLDGRSFPGLWGHQLAIFGLESCALLSASDPLPADQEVILLPLKSHLEVLSQSFGVSEPIAQLPLFPAVGLRRSEASNETDVNTARLAAAGDAA